MLGDGRRTNKWWLIDSEDTAHLAVVGEERQTKDGHYTYLALEPFDAVQPLANCHNAGTVVRWLAQMIQDPGGDAWQDPAKADQLPTGLGITPDGKSKPQSPLKKAPPSKAKVSGAKRAQPQEIGPLEDMVQAGLKRRKAQEDEALEAATRQAVVRELQQRAAAEKTHRAAAKQAALHWLQAPLQRADLEYVQQNIRTLQERLARADAAWQTAHAPQASNPLATSEFATGAAAAAAVAPPAAMQPLGGVQAASPAPQEGLHGGDGIAVGRDAEAAAEHGSEPAIQEAAAGSSRAGPSRLARVTHASTLSETGDASVTTHGQTSMAVKSPTASVPTHGADLSAGADTPADIAQQSLQSLTQEAPNTQQAAAQHSNQEPPDRKSVV